MKNIGVIGIKQRHKLTVRINGEDRTVGIIDGNKFITQRNKDHWVKKYSGVGISKKVLDKLINEFGTDKIVIIYNKVDGTQEIWTTTPKKWRRKGTVDKLGGFEEQVFLPKFKFD